MTTIYNAQPTTHIASPHQAFNKIQDFEEPSFKDFLLESIEDVNSMQKQADQAVETLMTGGDAEPAEVLTAVQKADMAFRLLMQMRNKMMQVYQEVRDIRI